MWVLGSKSNIRVFELLYLSVTDVVVGSVSVATHSLVWKRTPNTCFSHPKAHWFGHGVERGRTPIHVKNFISKFKSPWGCYAMQRPNGNVFLSSEKLKISIDEPCALKFSRVQDIKKKSPNSARQNVFETWKKWVNITNFYQVLQSTRFWKL